MSIKRMTRKQKERRKAQKGVNWFQFLLIPLEGAKGMDGWHLLNINRE